MLKEMGAALLMDLIGTIKSEKDFFSLDTGARKKALESRCGQDYPKVFSQYVSDIGKDKFMGQVKEAISVFDGNAYASADNSLLSSLSDFISGDFARKFDSLSLAFFFEDLGQRTKTLRELFPGDSALSRTTVDILIRGTYQEIGQEANRALSRIKDTPTIVIQSPVELAGGLKGEIREHVVKKYPHSFAEFQVNPQIIGGMRVFVSGKVIDNSWLSRIQALGRINI